MAVKFITCYPVLPQGGKTPCGIALDKQSGLIREVVCPELPEEQCRNLAARWNDSLSDNGGDGVTEEIILQFITAELKRAITA